MPQTVACALRVLRGSVPRRDLAALGLLSLGGSLTEGVGLVMLVPLLHLATGESRVDLLPGGLDEFAERIGLPWLLALFVVLVFLRSALVQTRVLVEIRLQMTIANAVRDRVFRKLMQANWRFLAERRQGELLAVVLNTVDRAVAAMQFIMTLAATALTLAAVLAAAMLIAPWPALSLGAGGVLILAAYAGLRRRAASQGAALGKAWGAYYDYYGERMAALRAIKVFGVHDAEAAAARSRAVEVQELRLAFQRGMGASQVLLQASAAVALALTVWLGLTRWHMAVSTLLPLVALAARAVPLLGIVQMAWQQWAHDAPAFAELETIMDSARAAAEPQGVLKELPPMAAGIVLNDVTVRFAAREKPALDCVSIAFPLGTTTFVTGPSGAGKSTLADLLGGLILPDAGTVTVDGASLADAGLAAWRRQVAYVQQEPLLFDATIRENLLWVAPEAGEAELRRVLAAASAEFVFDLPNGLDTRAGASGRQLSGGERQRIVLARSLLRRPSLLILDEATSALDAANELAVRNALERLKGRLTMVIIGHRGALADLADQRIELADGRIVSPA